MSRPVAAWLPEAIPICAPQFFLRQNFFHTRKYIGDRKLLSFVLQKGLDQSRLLKLGRFAHVYFEEKPTRAEHKSNYKIRRKAGKSRTSFINQV